jgi:uncharacterized iron-regulated membrane protein
MAQALRLKILKWHRWLTIVLSLQLGLWLITALSMALVPRAATTAYKAPKSGGYNAAVNFPEGNRLASAVGPQAVRVSLEKSALRPVLSVYRSNEDDEKPVLLDPASLGAAQDIPSDEIAAWAADLTKERIDQDAVVQQDQHDVSYQKLPLPALRIEAAKATLFLDPKTGALLGQTTPAKLFENVVTTIHVMDWTGKALFRKNVFLTFFALVFLCAAALGVLAVRRVYLVKGMGLMSLRLHQGLGLLLGVQVLFWVSSGLGVVWLLEPLRTEAHGRLNPAPTPIDWAQVKVRPAQIPDALADGGAQSIHLTMLLGKPVYQAQWSGKGPGQGGRQALYSATTGQPIKLTEQDRDAIAATVLQPDSAGSIARWTVANSPKDLDFYFYTGPYPVWKGFFESPMKGAVAIDQVTGLVHTPRTDREIFLERYYNLHVVNWRFGVVKYRQEPALLAVIVLAMAMFATGAFLQIRRWRLKAKS